MWDLKKSKVIDGVTFTLQEDEFDTLIVTLKEVAQFSMEHTDDQNYAKQVNHVADVLATKSYFDVDEKEVRCMLGFTELNNMIDVLINVLPRSKDLVTRFETCIADPKSKKWTTYKKKVNE